jgi:hypothetical protein
MAAIWRKCEVALLFMFSLEFLTASLVKLGGETRIALHELDYDT